MENCESIDIIGYIEGTEDGRKAAGHIENCAPCKEDAREYTLLLKGIVEHGRRKIAGCRHRETTVTRAVEEADEDEAHLAGCPECAKLNAQVRQMLRETDAEPGPTPGVLPAAITERVAERKKEWQLQQTEKAIDLQGIRDEKEREAARQKLLEEQGRQMPKAAISDDLKEDEPEE